MLNNFVSGNRDYLIKASGFDGFVSIEFEGMEDNLKGIQIGLDNIRRFIA